LASLETIRRLTIQAEERNLDAVSAKLRGLSDAQAQVAATGDAVAVSSETSSRTVENASRRYENLQRRIDPLHRELTQLSRDFRDLDAANAQGLGLDRRAADLDLIIARTKAAQEETRRLAQIENERVAQNAAHAQAGINEAFGIGGQPATARGATFSALADEMKRLEDEEKRFEEVQRLRGEAIGQAFQQGLNDSFGIGGRSAVQGGATFSALEEEMKRLDGIATALSAHIAEVSQRNIGALTGQGRPSAISQGATFSALAEDAARHDDLQKAANELLQRIDPLGEATKRYNAELLRNKEMLDRGILSTMEFAKANEFAAQKVTQVQKGVGLSTSAVTNLSFQLNDVISGFVMGQSPFTILAQQGGQVYQALQGPQGIAAGAKNAAMWLVSLVTPARVAGAALIGAAVEASLAWMRFSDQQREIQTTLGGLGRGLGIGPQQFNALTSGVAASIGLSERQAANLGLTLARTGNIGVESLAQLAKLSKDFAATLGIDDQEAAKLLGTLGTIGGVKSLNDQLRFLNASALQTVTNLFEVGRKEEAIGIAATKLKDALVPYNDSVSASRLIWDAISNKISDIDRATGRWLNNLLTVPAVMRNIKEATPEQSVAAARSAGQSAGLNPSAVEAGLMRAGLTNTPSPIPQMPLPPTRPPDTLPEADRDREFEIGVERARKAAAELRNINEQSEIMRQRIMETGIPSGELEKLQTQYKALLELQRPENAALREAVGTSQDLNEAVSRTQHVLENLRGPTGERITDEQRTQQIMEKTIQLQDAWDVSTRTRLEQEIKALQLGKERITVEDAANQVQDVAKRNEQERAIAIREDITARQRQLALMGLSGPEYEVQNQLLQKELEYRRARNQLSPAELAVQEQLIRKTEQQGEVQTQLQKIYSDFQKPSEDLAKTVIALDQKFAEGAINIRQYGNALLDARIKAEEAKNTFEGGLSAGLLKVNRDFGDLSKNMENAVTSSFGNFSSALVDLEMGTKKFGDAFKDLGTSVARTALEMVNKMLIARAIGAAMGMFGGGGLSTSATTGISSTAASGSLVASDISAAIHHRGGIVGINGEQRYVHPAYFDNAPRYHMGGLAADEVPAILRRNEEVLPQSDPRHRWNGGGAAPTEVHIHNAVGAQVSTQNSITANGGPRTDVVIGEMVASGIRSPEGRAALAANYGLKPQLTRR
jgi:lambda family phage tail tape measure protein